MSIDALLQGDPQEWVRSLPAYQREPIEELLAQGDSFEEVIERWLSASAENTFRFGVEGRAGGSSVFKDKLLHELEDFICGSAKYDRERSGLFGEQSPARTYVISAIAVAIAPPLGVTAAFLAPIVALTLAACGKITINAWCEARKAARQQSP